MGEKIIILLLFSACIMGPALIMAAAAYASIGALGRNPSAAPKILPAMIIILIFAEALAVIAMLLVYQLFV